jgi:NDP-sugar pyrophosphorylase family protein
MIAVIMLPGPSASLLGLDDRHPAALLPIGDRPVLQHIIEHLRDRNVRRFEFILGQSPERIEGHFGNGTRWGCSFHWHLAHDAETAYRLLPIVAGDPDQLYFLAEAARFPFVNRLELDASDSALVFTVDNSSSSTDAIAASVWSPRTLDLRRAAAGRDSFHDYLAELRHTGKARSMCAEEFIDARDGLRLLSSQLRVFEHLPESPGTSRKETAIGIRIARNVAIHPSAKLTAPVYIGPNSRIGRNVQLGPNTVIGPNCVIDHHSALSNSLILQGTYVGQKLELADVIVDHDLLVNARLSTSVPVSDNFLLGALLNKVHRSLGHRGLSAVLASILFLVLLPVFVGTLVSLCFTRRGWLLSRDVLCLPAPPGSRRWKTFSILVFQREQQSAPPAEASAWRYLLMRFIPGLLSIIRGDCSFVGLPPRTPAEVESLSPEWKSVYLDGKPGLISEALVQIQSFADPTELYLCDAFYNATQSIAGDLKLLTRFAAKLLIELASFAKIHRSVE